MHSCMGDMYLVGCQVYVHAPVEKQQLTTANLEFIGRYVFDRLPGICSCPRGKTTTHYCKPRVHWLYINTIYNIYIYIHEW